MLQPLTDEQFEQFRPHDAQKAEVARLHILAEKTKMDIAAYNSTVDKHAAIRRICRQDDGAVSSASV